MIAVVFSSLLAGLLALLLYQRMAYPFLWLDLIYYFKLRGYRKTLQARMQKGIVTYLDCFLYQAKTNPNKPFIIFENRTLTYQVVDRRSNKFANAFRTEGSLKQRDIVALGMFNEPDFICVWLGLCKLGCEVAFLNVNIKAKSLLHCLQSCGAKTLVVGAGIALFSHVFCAVLAFTSTLSIRPTSSSPTIEPLWATTNNPDKFLYSQSTHNWRGCCDKHTGGFKTHACLAKLDKVYIGAFPPDSVFSGFE